MKHLNYILGGLAFIIFGGIIWLSTRAKPSANDSTEPETSFSEEEIPNVSNDLGDIFDDLRAQYGGWKDKAPEGALWVHMERELGQAETKRLFTLVRGYFKGHNLFPHGYLYSEILNTQIKTYLSGSPKKAQLTRIGEFL